uniref:Cathelicidin-3-like isoform X4 n=1 Tax=Tursiops truncatus TaxID=9739 RepID=A0A6J3QVI8_TURTR|nr:cathelicidin-3-like isoform X4 [Tursiops truncatus]XP_033706317.1 cathelicidin-3-like isoform X4 [Tursiops truncatus]
MKWEVGRKTLTRSRERVLTLSPDPSLHPHSSRGCLPYSLQRAGGRAEFPPLVPVRRPAWWDQDLDTPKPVSFTVKETVCLRTTQQPPEQCDFKENGLVKQCVGTVTLDQSKDQFDIKCNELQSVRRIRFRPPYLPRPGRRPRFPPPFPIPRIPRIP